MVEPLHLTGDDSGGARPQRGDGRRHGLHHPRGEVGGDLPGDEVADRLHLGQRLDVGPVREDRPQLGEPDEGGAGLVTDGRVDVMGQGQVDEDPFVTTAGRRGGDEVGADEVLGRAGRGDDDVGLGDGVDQAVHPDGPAAGGLGQPFASRQGPVRDEDAAHTAAGGGRGGQAGHATGADDEHGTRRQRTQDALRLVEASLYEGAAHGVDGGLVVSPLADPKRLLQ